MASLSASQPIEFTAIVLGTFARLLLLWAFGHNAAIDSLHFGGPIMDTPITDVANVAECTGLLEQGIAQARIFTLPA